LRGSIAPGGKIKLHFQGSRRNLRDNPALLPVGEKSVLEIQIERLKRSGFKEIFLATNYKSEYIENFFGDGSRYGVKLVVSKEKTPLGTAGPLLLLKESLGEPFVVMNGDILSLIDFKKFYEFAISKDSLLTVAIKKEITPYSFGNIFFEGDYVTGIEEKPNIIMHILAGIYAMKPEIFRFFPGKNVFWGMDSLIQKMLKEKSPISKYEMSEYWLDIGRIDDFEEAQTIYSEHFLEE